MSQGSSNRSPSWNRQPLTSGSSAFSLESYSDVTQIAKTLSAFGGGAVAQDLALDLVLNEVVEQARLATGADGAAVALLRDGEMVCRATSGDHAPELGTRIEISSGLSGECLKTGRMQYCSDTETDLRVDAESCRQLGIRSAMLLPLSDDSGTFGILKTFSSRANAFGERDINTLRALGGRVLASKAAAEKGSAAGEEEDLAEIEAPTIAHSSDPTIEKRPAVRLMADSRFDEDSDQNSQGSSLAVRESRPESLSEFSPDDRLPTVLPPAGNEMWTTVLVVLVIGAAIALGVVIGWRGAMQGSVAQGSAPLSAPKAKTNPSNETAPATPSGSAQNPPELSASPGPVSGSNSPSTNNAAPAQKPKTPNAIETATGGLTVTDNGKVVYRLPGKPIAGSKELPASSQPDETRLIHRVDPEYPEEARNKNIQGAVVLDVQVLENGRVGGIEIASGEPVLSQAAIRAVKQWRYRPFAIDGRPVQSQTRVTIRFTLPSS